MADHAASPAWQRAIAGEGDPQCRGHGNASRRAWGAASRPPPDAYERLARYGPSISPGADRQGPRAGNDRAVVANLQHDSDQRAQDSGARGRVLRPAKLLARSLRLLQATEKPRSKRNVPLEPDNEVFDGNPDGLSCRCDRAAARYGGGNPGTWPDPAHRDDRRRYPDHRRNPEQWRRGLPVSRVSSVRRAYRLGLHPAR